MDLRTWLFKNDMTQVEFAEKIGVHRRYVSQLIRGKHHPRIELAKKIIQETDGEVTLEDLYLTPKSQKVKRKQKKENPKGD